MMFDNLEDRIILRCVVGSSVHGLNVPGSDDRDEMAVCIEPLEYLLGLKHFEQYVYRTAEERAKHSPGNDQRYNGRTPKSEAGDLDFVCYSLRKYCRLAAQGNPSLLILLFAQGIDPHPMGLRLQDLKSEFASKEAGKRFLGYFKAQKERLLGIRGQMRVTRTELIGQYGYDTKYAMHVCRLGLQGLEYMKFGRITLPVPQPYNSYLMNIRLGKTPYNDVMRWIVELEKDLEYAITVSKLPDKPNYDAINKFLVECYSEFNR